MLNYEVLAHIWDDRRRHKLDEWREHHEIDLSKLSKLPGGDGMKVTAPKKIVGFCDWIKTLPYPELICGDGIYNKEETLPDCFVPMTEDK